MDDTTRHSQERSFQWGRWISLFCAFSFIILGLDAGMSHMSVLGSSLFPYIPIIVAPVATLLSLAAVFWVSWRRFAWIAGVLAFAVGIAGGLFHNALTLIEGEGLPLLDALLYATRPPFAPLAFASTGVLMLFVAWAER